MPTKQSNKPSLRQILLTVIVLLILIVIFFPPFSKWQKLREENMTLEKRIEELTAENAELEENIHKLKTDPVYLEERAREKLKKTRKGEIVYRTP